ncbi:MAG TPA: SH3 domain-containing protein [Polyangiaceae bacterium]|nr:SH3 domain-containing protein [Polyangiaceae bacterium]
MNRPRKPAKKSARPSVTERGPVSLRVFLVIAGVGFVVGLVWPRLAGLHLVPEAPIEEARSVAEEPATEVTQATARANEPEPHQLTQDDLLEIGEPEITSCRDEAGKEKKTCDALDLDDRVHPTLRALGECPGAKGAFGSFSLGFTVDFEKKRIGEPKSGRSTDMPASVVDELLRCAKQSLVSVGLEGLEHASTSYVVFYRLRFKTPEAALAREGAIVPASGQADVRWRTALVREEPERDARVRERVLAGARLVVTGRKGEWYRVKYDAQGREGWVHGAALGMSGK